MVFSCVPEGPLMDYMNREATEKFLEITHEEYFRRFPQHFGTTIDSVFYDEPTLYRNQGRTRGPKRSTPSSSRSTAAVP